MALLYTNGDNETDGGSLELDGASVITSADVGGTTYVFVGGAVDDGVSVFSLSRAGVLTNVYNVTDSGSLNLVGVSGLTTVMSGGATYLVAAGTGDNGLSVFRVATNGALTSVYNLADSGSTYLNGVARMASATVGGSAYVFAAGTNEDGISAFRVEANGVLTSVSNTLDGGTLELDGVRGLTTATIGSNTFLFAAGSVDDGVSVLQINANGTLTETNSVTDNATYRLDGASDVATAVVNGTTYLFVTGAVDGGVSVFSVNSSGVLTNVDNVGDTGGLRLAGANSVTATAFGASTYLTVGGTEGGVSLFKVNSGGTLTFVQNIDDGGSLELSGTSTLHTASVGGVNYLLAAGSTDDGVSVLGLKHTGQLWAMTDGAGSPGAGVDTRVFTINGDGSNQTTVVDNSSGTKFARDYVADMGVDTAAGFYFAIVNSDDNDTAQMVRGQIGSSAAPTVLTSWDPKFIVNSLQVDAINHKIYVAYFDGQDANGAISGIKVFTYTSAGAVTDTGFLTTGTTDNRPQLGGFDVLDPLDFALDTTNNRLFYSERVDWLTTGLYRIDLASPNNATRLVANQFGEPDGSGNPPNGFIGDVEVDTANGRLYFTTSSQNPSGTGNYVAGQNALWMISETATASDSATQVALVGLPGGNKFYPGDMTFDPVSRQLYIESEETDATEGDDVIYVFQLDGAGTTATLINTIAPNPVLSHSGGNIEGLAFASLPVLSVSGTSTAAVEQGSAVTLLTGAPTITDSDGGYLTGATVAITGGKFTSNEASTADDHLGISGNVSGTIGAISYSWNAATETLTLTGYDTIANYKAVLAQISYWTTGDNPTNYGFNTNRTITWTVNDGTDAPGGSVNSATTTLTITGGNDAPVNTAPAAISAAENGSIAVTGLQVADVDTAPGAQNITVTVSAAHGTVTLLTNVAGGLTSGEISGNGTATVTITGTLNEINATLAATNGLTYTNTAYNGGTDTLTVVTNDGGASDTDNYGITVTASNDAPVVPPTATTVGATEQTPAILLGSVTVSDADLDARNSNAGDYAGASFTVQRTVANATDTFSFNTSGALFTVSGGNLQVGGLTVATFTSTGGVLTINFTSSGTAATTALVNDIIDHITYTNTSDAPPASVSLNYVLNDGGGQGAGGILTDSGSVTVNITATNDNHTGGASITGTAAEDQTLTAVSTLADADGLGTLHYQWQHDVGGGYVNVGSDQSTYVLGDGDIGGIVRVVIYYTDAGGTVESATSAATAAISATNDAPTGGVSITGTTTEDQVLTADTSTLADSDGLGTLHYDWQRNTGSGYVSIGAADQATYTLGDADVAGLIRVVVSYTDGQGFANNVTSGGTAAITGVNDPHTGGASVTGTAAEDQVLTAVSTLADVDGIGTLHYDWQRDTGSGFTSTGAADQATYTLGDADVGGLLRVVISYTDAQGFTESATAAATATVTGVNDAPTGGVSLTGTATEDQVLTANTSTLADADGLGTLHYDWQRDTGSGFVTIGAADQATYTLGDVDVGKAIRVVVSYTDGQGFSNNVTSAGTAAVAAVNDPHTGGASVTGTATEDQVLTAVSTLADVDGLGTLHYQWQHDVGGGYVNVGTDAATYTLGDADVGGLVRVVVSYTDGQGFAESATSAATAAIAGINDAPTGGATITGTVSETSVLTADTSTLADADGLGTLHYDWQRDSGSGFTSIGAADQATYTLANTDVGKTVRVVVSYTDGQGFADSVTSAATATVSAYNDPPTGAVSITGTTTEDQVLTADASTVADADGLGTFHYDWQRNTGSGYVSIGAADQATYTLGDADVGGLIRVVVSYTDGQGFANSINSAGTAAIAGVNDPHTGGVSITGTATEDQVLTATSTLVDVDGLGTLHYQWQHDVGAGYVNIGTDAATYTLGDADVGGVVRVVVSYTDGQGFTESATAAATAAVTAINDAPTGGVSITGTATEDQVLTAASTLADADGLGTLHYDWQRDTGSGYVSIGAADQATYTLGDADVGGLIRVVVSYTDGQGFSNNATSTATAAIAGVNDGHTGGASITGTATEDQVLTAVSTLADVDGLGTLHYTWQRDTGSGFVNTGAADQATYTLGDADVGGVVRVVISYTDGQGFLESATSTGTAAVAAVNDAPTGGASITGTATEDQVLTVSTATLADADGLGVLSYQWQRSNGAGYDNVGSNATTYTLGDADVGKAIRVVVSYTDGQGFANSVTSTATAAIAGVNDAHTGGVSITGTATEDQVLTAASTLADVDGLGTLHYNWQRDTGSGYVNIGAADQATYMLGDADVGGVVRVVVSYTDGQGFAESATSAATATIVNVNDLPTGTVTIAGSALPGQTLTAGNSLADGDGLGTISYQWKSNGTNIAGATGSTLVLASSDIGAAITVVASYTDQHGTAESVASTAVTVDTDTPPPTTTTTIIDGAPVETTKTTNADGTVTQTTTISPVTPAATEQTADIPLFTENGQSLLSVSAPVGFSMTITGNDKPESANSSIDNLVTAIRGAGGDTSQTGAGGDFLSTLTSDSRVLVQTITPTVAPNAGINIPLTFEGSPPTNGVYTALVLDVSHLPSGTIINLNNIDFVTIIGATQVGGGEGSQIVFGDNEDQYIVLGADDDVLHGGGGNDTVGSKGGNDKIYGDAGNDILFGGEGNDFMDGGSGADTVLMGGNLKDYIFVHTGAGLQSISFEGDDTMINVETLKMVDGTTITDLNKLVQGTTSVAVMTYEFFTGKTPTAAGLEYLLHAPNTVNANDLSDPYYTKFNVDNRYINFAINLASPQGQAHTWFETNYGALNFEQTITKAYKEIFGVTLTNDKMQHLLYDQVGGNMTRLHYFELFAGSAEGAKAGIIGWLLAAAVLENTGRYAAANTAFLNDFADGNAQLNVDLVGVYGDGHAWGTLN